MQNFTHFTDNKNKRFKRDNRFNAFECVCSSKENNKIGLIFDSPKKFQCILINYKMYAEKRDFWNSLNLKYKNEIERNILYPNEFITKLKIIEVDQDMQSGTFKDLFKLQIVPAINNSFYKYANLNCCFEIHEFINTHIYNDDLNEKLKNAKSSITLLSTTNF
ncbi:hypothetical protein CsNV_013 [Callinectes sapidus nudivirus]|nr:hypothetical protein CsNV_013 [Callinectes sapidus nudivirus]